MLVLGNFIIAIARIFDIILFWVWILILVRALVSWVNADPYNPIVRFLYSATEPILQPIRRRLPPSGNMDWSPLVAFLLIIFLQSFFVVTLKDIGYHMRSQKTSEFSEEFQLLKDEAPVGQDETMVY